MIAHVIRAASIALLLNIALPLSSAAQAEAPWNQTRITELAAQLHDGVRGLREETRSIRRDSATMQAAAYFRLLDNLRLIERETRYLHKTLESGGDRDTTRPIYARIAMLRRDCAEEMERMYVGSPSLQKISRARSIVKEMDPFYGFDPDRADHDRVLTP